MKVSIFKRVSTGAWSFSLIFLLLFGLPRQGYGQEEVAPEEALPPPPPSTEEMIEAEVQKRLAEREKALREEFEKRLQEKLAEARKKEMLEAQQKQQKAPLYFQYLKKWAEEEKTYDLLIAELQSYIYLYEDLEGVDEAQYMLAHTYEKLGETGKALVEHLRLIYLYPQSGYLTASRETVSRLATEEFPKVKEAILKVAGVTGVGDRASLNHELVKSLPEIKAPKLYPLFIEECQNFMRKFPTYFKVDEVQFLMSNFYHQANKPYQAIAGYDKVLMVYPESPLCPTAQLTIGHIRYRDLKQYDRAIEVYERVARKYPDSPEVLDAYRSMAEVAELKQGEYMSAIGYHERIVKKYPRSPHALEALSSIARIYETRLKDYGMAIRTHERMADMFPGDEAIKAFQKAAIIAEKRARNYLMAINLYEAIVRDYPQDKRAAEALNSIARIYKVRMKEYDKAIQTYERLADMFPGERAVKAFHEAAAIAEKRLKDYAQTIRIYDRFVRSYPEHAKAPQAMFNIGKIYEKRLRDLPKAIDIYKQVVNRWPDSPLAPKAQKRVEALTKKIKK